MSPARINMMKIKRPVCAEGSTQNVGTHGMMHTHQSVKNAGAKTGILTFANGSTTEIKVQTYKQAKANGIAAMKKTFPNADCDPDCIEKQLDNYHNQAGINDDTEITAVVTGKTSDAAVDHATSNAASRLNI